MQLGLPFGRPGKAGSGPAKADPHVPPLAPGPANQPPPRLRRSAGTFAKAEAEPYVLLDGHAVPVQFVRKRGARHYILRVQADGGLRITVPWHGSKAEALRFVDERREWLVRERYQRTVEAAKRIPWQDGTPVLFRGTEYPIRVVALDAKRVRISFADQSFVISVERSHNLRLWVEAFLRRVATIDLPERLARLSRQHGFEIKAVSIRNQRSRWGSCSTSGRISLNWRLIQFPETVVDYVLIHELVHLRHMNHSRRFWNEVARLCPDYATARKWLRARQRKDGDPLWAVRWTVGAGVTAPESIG